MSDSIEDIERKLDELDEKERKAEEINDLISEIIDKIEELESNDLVQESDDFVLGKLDMIKQSINVVGHRDLHFKKDLIHYRHTLEDRLHELKVEKRAEEADSDEG